MQVFKLVAALFAIGWGVYGATKWYRKKFGTPPPTAAGPGAPAAAGVVGEGGNINPQDLLRLQQLQLQLLQQVLPQLPQQLHLRNQASGR